MYFSSFLISGQPFVEQRKL